MTEGSLSPDGHRKSEDELPDGCFWWLPGKADPDISDGWERLYTLETFLELMREIEKEHFTMQTSDGNYPLRHEADAAWEELKEKIRDLAEDHVAVYCGDCGEKHDTVEEVQECSCERFKDKAKGR